MLRVFRDAVRRLTICLYRPVEPSETIQPLSSRDPITVDFADFRKGVDNIHVDVGLSPRFVLHATRIIDGLVGYTVGRGRRLETSSGPTQEQWERFRSSYVGLIESAVHRAKAMSRPSLVQLVQLAVVKWLLATVNAQLEDVIQGVRKSMASGGITADHDRIHMNECLSRLVRNRARLRCRINRQLFGQLRNMENGGLAELRHSLLGARWPVPEDVLFNPLLQVESLDDDDVLIGQYVFLRHDADDPYTFSALDGLLSTMFRRTRSASHAERALPAAEETQRGLPAGTGKSLKGGVHGVAQRNNGKPSQPTKQEARRKRADEEVERLRRLDLRACDRWADVPGNVDILFNVSQTQARLDRARKGNGKPDVHELKRHLRFQRRARAVVERRFRAAGLLTDIVAAYKMPSLYKDYSEVLSAQELHEFLAAPQSRSMILAKLQRQTGAKALSLEPLSAAADEVDWLSCGGQQECLVRFLKDFTTFRRDRLSYQTVQQAMASIRLLEDPRHVQLSRANNTLYEFLAADEEGRAGKTILNHVVLKADVRGSTTLVAELRRRELNPASYFSLHFYDPLREMLTAFGASIVFLEGDAVILSLEEYAEAPEQQLSVARMCGVAGRLLSMTRAQNAHSREQGLPEMELGVGIVFSEESPAFLYNGRRKVMISPAIGKADRLSSCSWMLRKERGRRSESFVAGANVAVFEIPEGDRLRGEKGEMYLRYNSNGIELDAAAFAKLRTEVVLREITLLVAGEQDPSLFFAGRFPDLNGNLHSLVVRGGKIRRLDMGHPHLGAPTGQAFYEVVVDEPLMSKVAAAAHEAENMGDEHAAAATNEGAQQGGRLRPIV